MARNNTAITRLTSDKNRRTALVMMASSAAVIWQKPVINAVLTPAHAQTSICSERLAQVSDSNIAIPGGTNVDINLVIPDVQQDCEFTPQVTQVRLEFEITSPFIGDLTATLTSPDGNSQQLFANVCGLILGMNITLDDSAVTTIPNGTDEGDPGCPPLNGELTGSFNTGGALNSFNGETPDGLWVLNINDDIFIDPATVQNVILSVTSA